MIQARSIGKRAGEIVRRPPGGGRVLASFARVCDLLTDEVPFGAAVCGAEVFALAWDGVKNGPLNILLDNQPGAALPAGTRFVVSATGMQFLVDPPVEIGLTGAREWDARPDWDGLIGQGEHLAAGARVVASVLAAEAPEASLARLPIRLPAAAHAIADLNTAHAQNDLPALRAAASRLCGLGPGLTPAGDDWLAGWLIGLRVRGDPAVDAAGEAIVDAAQERTTLLSRAFLACAAAGEVDENWQELLSALARECSTAVVETTRRILEHGATSGADMLSGFLVGIKVKHSQTYL